jgi:hypothetical protein
MTERMSRSDFEAAKKSPHAFFAEPQQVVDRADLSKRQKIAILRHWEQDALHLSASESEGMGGGEDNMIVRVEHAIQTLRDTRH